MPILTRVFDSKLRHPISVAVVVSRYSSELTDKLLEGARGEFERRLEAGLSKAALKDSRLDIVPAPGSFEIPGMAATLAESGEYDAVVCLGCVVKGETKHDEYIASSVANALQQVACMSGVTITFGLLTTDTWDQALARAGGPMGNKGAEAMAAAIEAVAALNQLDGE